ncbi:MAG: carboxypeptidase-like regulatory domain-containing protein [Acidobacteriota bacterium]
MRRVHLGVVACLAVIGGCKDLPTEPDRRNPSLTMVCMPTGISVSCAATLHDVPSRGSVRDVTTEATWQVSDPSLGGFVRPGLFMPTSHGEAGVSARYEQWEAAVTDWFLVGPDRPAQWLYWLAGYVRDAAMDEAIAGAEVHILDGYAHDARALTNQYGYYQIDKILTGEAFTVTVSKDGYAPLTQSYRVDPPVGPGGNSPFLDFRLARLP